MAKIEVQATTKYHKTSYRERHVVIVSIDGVAFETECTGPDTAMDLAVKTAKALGIGYKKYI